MGQTTDEINKLRTRKRWVDHEVVPFGVPINYVMAVPDDGNKNRIVTKSHPGLIVRS